MNYEGGGVAHIFQLGDSGCIPNEIHGIIAAPNDQISEIKWGCTEILLGGTSTVLGYGNKITIIMSAACGTGTAARLCEELENGGYSGWYLPSLDELTKLYLNKLNIGCFSSNYYWSSSEKDILDSCVIYFNNELLEVQLMLTHLAFGLLITFDLFLLHLSF